MDSPAKRIGRPPKYASDDERRQADRERKRRERSGADVDSSLPAVDVDEEVKTSSPVVVPMPELDRYVEDATFMAELAHSQASPNASDSTKSLAETIERAEAYARWRYAGVLEGTVNGL